MIAPPALTVAAAIVVAVTAAAAPPSGSAATVTSACVASTGSFSWGFKESFRAYVSGSIANGEWSTAGGITYATPSFSSNDLAGDVRLDTMSGDLAVDGSIRFTGHDGILDTTISDPRLLFDGVDTIVMVVDITGTTQEFVEVSAADVPFVTGDLSTAEWSVDGDALVIESIPLELTAEGAEAFGTYPEGEPFDALTVRLDSGADCAALALEARPSAGVPLTLLVAVGLALGGAATAGVLVARGGRRRAD